MEFQGTGWRRILLFHRCCGFPFILRAIRYEISRLMSFPGCILFLCLITPSYSIADTPLFNKAGWMVDGGTDTGPNPRAISVSVQGKVIGKFSELKLYHEIEGSVFPQVFSIKGNGALRPSLPAHGEFGGTFYLTGYWDCESGFIQNMAITRLDVRVDPRNRNGLRLKGKITNLSSFKASDFTLRFLPPTLESVKVKVSYTLVATRNLCIDQSRQAQNEGFRLARIASNFISTETHDSDSAGYVNRLSVPVCSDLRNEDGFIFPDPLPMGASRLALNHIDSYPRNTPTLLIRFLKPSARRIIPQGFVSASDDPNDDNVDVWGNWDKARKEYAKKARIGRFEYTLEAVPPGLMRCQ